MELQHTTYAQLKEKRQRLLKEIVRFSSYPFTTKEAVRRNRQAVDLRERKIKEIDKEMRTS